MRPETIRMRVRLITFSSEFGSSGEMHICWESGHHFSKNCQFDPITLPVRIARSGNIFILDYGDTPTELEEVMKFLENSQQSNKLHIKLRCLPHNLLKIAAQHRKAFQRIVIILGIEELLPEIEIHQGRRRLTPHKFSGCFSQSLKDRINSEESNIRWFNRSIGLHQRLGNLDELIHQATARSFARSTGRNRTGGRLPPA